MDPSASMGSAMESLAARLYQRLGARYLWLLPGVIVVTALGASAVAGAAAVAYIDNVPASVFLWITVIAFLGSLVATVLSTVTARHLMRPFWDWIAGARGPEHAETAWVAGTQRLLPAILAGVGYFSLLAGLPALIYAGIEAGFTASGFFVLFGGVEIVIAGAAVVDFLGVEGLVRPVLREIAAQLPSEFQLPVSRLGVRWRLIASSSIITLFTGTVIGGATANVSDPTTRIALGVVVALGMTLTIALLLTALLTRSIASPVAQLVRASRAVEEGDLSARVPVTATDELGILGHSFNAMVRGLRERETLRSALGSYVDPYLAERVLSDGELLEGEEVDVTLLVLDIRDFTAYADAHSAPETVALLNEFYGRVVPILARNGGHANKFLGDGLLAVFGAPERLPDHADRAVEAARSIAAMVTETYGGALRVGIGLNSGSVVAGTIGGGGKLDFTVIGDAVNVAARVEELTKETGTVILLTERTRLLLSSFDAPLEPIGEVALKGKSRATTVYGVPVGTERLRRPSRRRGAAP